jgi:hypothetical protein
MMYFKLGLVVLGLLALGIAVVALIDAIAKAL